MKIELATENETVSVFEMFSSFSGAEINKIGIEFSRPTLMTQVKELIEKRAVLIVKDGLNGVIGAVAGTLSPCTFSKDVFFNAALFYVQPEFRHKTAAFIKELLDFLKHTPATQLVISSPSYAGEVMNRFYHINGFEKLETHFIRKIERPVCQPT